MAMTGYDDWDDEGPSRGRRIAIAAVGVLLAVVLVWLVVVPALGDDDGGTQLPAAVGGTSSSTSTTGARASASTTTSSVERSTTTSTIDESATATTDAVDDEDATDTTDAPVDDDAPTESSVASAPATASPTSAPPAEAPYPTLPDGTPLPVVAIFDVETITLSGTVPSEAAAERLKTLAIANSKFPATLVEFLAIDPDVPESVPVRVLELTSARFPEGTADILPAHAAELDRVAAVMNALPNVTVLVVGHADQRGDEVRNFQLSEERAQAVVAYLVGQGIAPSRLSSRAVGEADLITIADDDASLQLNRRTEFVFSGLLVGA
jgi:outer membrane protein OmpA-like peptidoglycan-associated protein